jgi:hypothetical protein
MIAASASGKPTLLDLEAPAFDASVHKALAWPRRRPASSISARRRTTVERPRPDLANIVTRWTGV